MSKAIVKEMSEVQDKYVEVTDAEQAKSLQEELYKLRRKLSLALREETSEVKEDLEGEELLEYREKVRWLEKYPATLWGTKGSGRWYK